MQKNISRVQIADPQNDYLRCQTLWAKKDFDGAITCAKNIASQVGANTKARVYKLIADSYLQKKDTALQRNWLISILPGQNR